MLRFFVFAISMLLTAPAWADQKIAIIGDSMMAWNRGADKNVGHILSQYLENEISDFSKS